MTRRKQPALQVYSSSRTRECFTCGNVIEYGEQYTRRSKRLNNGKWTAIAKCASCVPIRGNHGE